MSDRLIMETLPVDRAVENYIKTIVLRTSKLKQQTEFRVLVPGNMAMLFFYFGKGVYEIREDRWVRPEEPVSFVGLQTEPRYFADLEEYEAVIIYLTPFGVTSLFGKDAANLVNKSYQQVPSLVEYMSWLEDDDFLALPLEERAARIGKGVGDFFLNKSQPAPETLVKIHHYVEDSHGTVQVKDLAEKLDLTRQNLFYLAKKHMGVNLNVYSRIERLRYAISLLQDGYKWSEIVTEAGYYDYSHLTKDLKLFTHMPVAKYKELMKHDNSDLTEFMRNQVGCFYYYLPPSGLFS
ncbi:MAG: AraC family transcriptional regulator [Spirochaetales bacterium]|nr:AraC family transcriptional regulator [Spirochaetales bacterium]